MEQTANLCAQVPASLLARIREEQEKAGMLAGRVHDANTDHLL